MNNIGFSVLSALINRYSYHYRFKTVRTVLAVLQSRLESFVMIEVTAFFKP